MVELRFVSYCSAQPTHTLGSTCCNAMRSIALGGPRPRSRPRRLYESRTSELSRDAHVPRELNSLTDGGAALRRRTISIHPQAVSVRGLAVIASGFRDAAQRA